MRNCSIFPKFSFVLLLCSFLFCCDSTLAAPPQKPGDYSVTHLDIRDAILSMVSVLRDQVDKLERHEGRERQLGEQLTRTLNVIERRSRGEEKNIENMAQYLSKLDEKIKFIQTTLEQHSDERKLEQEATRAELREIKQLLSQGNRGGSSSGSSSISGAAESKIAEMEDRLIQLKTIGERNSGKLDGLSQMIQVSTAEALAAAASASANAVSTYRASPSNGSTGVSHEVSESLINELNEIKEALGRTAEIESQLLSSKASQTDSDWQGELVESMDSQRKQLAQLEEEIGKALGLLGEVNTSTKDISTAVGQVSNNTSKGLENLETQVEAIGGNHSDSFSAKLATIKEEIHGDLLSGFAKLGNELKGISNIEKVLLDTGDSVLDTKRRLEYGFLQIMGDVNQQLNSHTRKLNDSLQSRFDGLGDSVLENQSKVMKNLTSRMEEEISQVWRQIGILYHQASRSANLLDEIHSQTSKYVNNSLDTMSSMDGKVGAITYRMGEVDDNLNYLLGRMSLVVQEFNMIKGGLGDALKSIKDSFAEISPDGEKKSPNLPAEVTDNEIEDTGKPIPIPSDPNSNSEPEAEPKANTNVNTDTDTNPETITGTNTDTNPDTNSVTSNENEVEE